MNESVNAGNNEKLKKPFIKSIDGSPGKLRKGLIRAEDSVNYFLPAEILTTESGEYYMKEQLYSVETPEGKVLQKPFRKCVPAEGVDSEAYYRAKAYTEGKRREQLEQFVQHNIQTSPAVFYPYMAAATVAVTNEIAGIIRSDRDSGDTYKMFYTNPNTGKVQMICNFKVTAISTKKLYDGGNYCNRLVRLRIEMGEFQMTEIEVDYDNLNDITKAVSEKFMNATLCAGTSGADIKLAEAVKEQLVNLPVMHVQTRGGWFIYNEKPIFAHDTRSYNVPEWEMNTGKKVLSNRSSHAENTATLRDAMELAPIEIIAPMVAVALLAPLCKVFRDANPTFEPHFALFINGKSGSLKTAVSKVLFNLFDADQQAVVASFRDTPTAVENRLKEFRDCPILLDDFYATAMGKERSRMQEVLETVVRYVGDGIGKNRSNGKLEDVKGTKPSGMVVITGEDTAGQMSTLLRCLILNVDKGVFDGSKLEVFQRDSLKWSSFLRDFIEFVEATYVQCQQHIAMSYEEIREQYANLFEDRRPADQLTQIYLAFDILGAYMALTCDKEFIHEFKIQCQEACMRAVRFSQEYAIENSGENQYIFTLAKLLFEHTITLAESRAKYAEGIQNLDGFEDLEFLYLKADAVYTKVRKYFKEQGREFSVTQLNAHRALNRAGVLVTETENRGTSREKVLYEVKVKVGEKRPRMLKIRRSEFDNFTASIVETGGGESNGEKINFN